MEAAVIVAVISLIGNLWQLLAGRKSKELDSIRKEIDILEKLQESKAQTYEEALKTKDVQIEELTRKVKEASVSIEHNSIELKRMQRVVTYLIAHGCQKSKTCPLHEAYSLDDLQGILSNGDFESLMSGE